MDGNHDSPRDPDPTLDSSHPASRSWRWLWLLVPIALVVILGLWVYV